MSKKKVLVTGSNGQLGIDIVKHFKEKGYETYGFSREKMDITDLDSVQNVFSRVKPEIVIHCAAYTKVDLAETNVDQAFLVNAVGTRNVSVEAQKYNAKLVYVSTDYVFNGDGKESYNEFDETSPLGVYGKSKLAGENFVKSLTSKYFVVRTSWVYGAEGNNFVKTMIKLAENNSEIKVVDDQVGCPTYTVDLAKQIELLVQTEKYGTYHISNSGNCSWYEFAKAIFKRMEKPVNILPVSTSEFPRPAKRPSYSVFDHMALRLNGFPKVRPWEEALEEYMKLYYS
jgi:dTDP-4-dehydrorhamnose reductase